MNKVEKTWLEQSLIWKSKYDNTKWWKFRLRKYYKDLWYYCREKMIHSVNRY